MLLTLTGCCPELEWVGLLSVLSQLPRQPSQMEETEVWEGCEPCVVAPEFPP